MNNVLKLAYRLLMWQRISKWLALIGLVFLLLVPFAALNSDNKFAFAFWMLAWLCLLALPFIGAPIAFRYMIANHRLSFIPGFHFHCGLALLLLVSMTSLIFPLGAALLLPDKISAELGVYMFGGVSLYAGFTQWAMTSRKVLLLMAILPFLFVVFLVQLQTIVLPLFYQKFGLPILFVVCCILWLAGLKTLSARHVFKPACTTPMHQNEHMGASHSWLQILFSCYLMGKFKSFTGTLLIGFPDGWRSRLFFTANLVVLSPLMIVTILFFATYVFKDARENAKAAFIAMFLLFSMIMAIVSSLGCGELAARCRLLWLRVNSTRKSQWLILENQTLSYLLFLNACTATSALLCMFISDQAQIDPVKYFLAIGACSLMGVYFSLAARIRQWPFMLQLFFICILGLGVAAAFLQSQVPLSLLALPVVLLALVFRWFAKTAFFNIDWTRIKPRLTLRSTVQ